MQSPDSTIARYLADHAGEHGALPLPVLLVLLIGIFALGGFTVWKLGNLKTYLAEPPFPTHAATVVAAIVVFLGLGMVAICRAALGMEWPLNYNVIVEMVMAGMLGVAVWGIGKRTTSTEAYDGRAKVEAAKAGMAVPTDMTATQEQRVPGVSRATDAAAAPDDGAVG
jgi:hypothetical protein